MVKVNKRVEIGVQWGTEARYRHPIEGLNWPSVSRWPDAWRRERMAATCAIIVANAGVRLHRSCHRYDNGRKHRIKFLLRSPDE